jgi:UDP-N-acetyl-D-glucosamine dehydrogenase
VKAAQPGAAQHDHALRLIAERTAKVVVVGQGYVGLPVAVRAAEAGYGVVGFDTDEAKIAMLQQGTSHVGDVGVAALAAALAGGYRASAEPADVHDFDIAVITVPTPLRDGAPDLSHVEHAGTMLADHLRPGAVVILESTTYPGTTTELLAPVLEHGSGLIRGVDFLLGYSPERIDPGNPKFDFRTTPKVVSGIDEASLAAVRAFYDTLVDTTVPLGNTAEAELVKLLENTFRHVNIALVNEIAMFARDLGVDVWRAIDAADTKPFGFMRFTPGPGVGGHCLPIDPSYLAWEVQRRLGRTMRFVEAANAVNHEMPHYVVDRISALLARHGTAVAGARILLLGLAYKRATGDWRESPSVPVAELLATAGASVQFTDPYVVPATAAQLPFRLVEWSPDAMRAADLVVVLVDHPEFEPAILADAARLIFDTKGIMRATTFCGEVL